MSDELPDKPEPQENKFLEDVSSYKGSVGRGIGCTVLLHLFQLPLAIFIPPIGFFSLIFIGLSQLIYMIPAFIYFRKQGETETAQGLIIGAGITFLLNAACTGIVSMLLQ